MKKISPENVPSFKALERVWQYLNWYSPLTDGDLAAMKLIENVQQSLVEE